MTPLVVSVIAKLVYVTWAISKLCPGGQEKLPCPGGLIVKDAVTCPFLPPESV